MKPNPKYVSIKKWHFWEVAVYLTKEIGAIYKRLEVLLHHSRKTQQKRCHL